MKTKLLPFLLLLAIATSTSAQEAKYQLSSHILDITQGKPATGVKIDLSKQDSIGAWTTIEEKYTDANGRIPDFLKKAKGVDNKGVYKLTYFTAPYFKSLGELSFYPFIEVVFQITDDNHYHVPITLSPFGYSTYRGN